MREESKGDTASKLLFQHTDLLLKRLNAGCTRDCNLESKGNDTKARPTLKGNEEKAITPLSKCHDWFFSPRQAMLIVKL